MPELSAIHFLIGIAVLLGVAYAAYRQYEKKKKSDITIPLPERLRTDLKFGYYGTLGNQIKETFDHINVLWEAPMTGSDPIRSIRDAGIDTILDVQACVFKHNSRWDSSFRENAEELLTIFFDQLRSEGILHLIKVIVPIDEPNATTKEADLRQAVEVIRKVIPNYHELDGVKLASIYYGGKPYFATELFDIIGFDKYNRRSGIFSPGAMYDELKSLLKPGQQTIIMPGGSYGQDPTPFVNFAHANPEVWGVIPFMWATTEDDGSPVPGIRDLPVRDAYVRAGESLVSI